MFEYFKEVFKIEEKFESVQFNEFLAEKIYNKKDKEDLCIILQNWGNNLRKENGFYF